MSNSEFGELSQTRHRSRTIRRRVYLIMGLTLIGLGYALMAVSPETQSNWALTRALCGMGCIMGGFGLAVFSFSRAGAERD
jgi:FtsH-binding integral membrane protein